MINVLHSELQSNIGGIESFLCNLLQCIDRKNIHFDFLMRGENKELERRLTNLGANIYKVPTGYRNYINFVKKLLKKNKYDIVHIHKNSAANILLPEIVKRNCNAKLIVHSHNTSPSNGSKLLILLHRINKKRLYNLADYHFACSDLAAEWMFGKDYLHKNVQVIKNGIIVKNFEYNSTVRKEIRKKLNIENKFVVGHVGAFRKQKNQEYLLRIVSRLPKENIKLILVGQGERFDYIKEKAKNYGIEEKVIFLGSRSDISDLLQAFDVFVMPSLWEGLSIAAIEAQASGLPVLLSDNVSKKSKVTNNVYFCNLENINNWIETISTIKKQFIRYDTTKEIEKAGYDMQKTAVFIGNFYKKILGE